MVADRIVSSDLQESVERYLTSAETKFKKISRSILAADDAQKTETSHQPKQMSQELPGKWKTHPSDQCVELKVELAHRLGRGVLQRHKALAAAVGYNYIDPALPVLSFLVQLGKYTELSKTKVETLPAGTIMY